MVSPMKVVLRNVQRASTLRLIRGRKILSASSKQRASRAQRVGMSQVGSAARHALSTPVTRNSNVHNKIIRIQQKALNKKGVRVACMQFNPLPMTGTSIRHLINKCSQVVWGALLASSLRWHAYHAFGYGFEKRLFAFG